jgi:hypothetical protein
VADQKFTAAKREALWLAHEKKCAYTRELLDVSSFHIDHVIPESLADDQIRLQEAKAKYHLPDDFDLFGFENLLPSKPGVNLQKADILLEPARIHFFLGVAASKKTQVEDHLRRIQKRQSGGRALILLQQSLERGELTAEQVAAILEKHAEQPQEIFRLMEAMKFVDADEISVVGKSDIADLWRRPVRLGTNTHIDSVTFTNRSGEKHVVRTCEEYDDAVRSGYWALDNLNLKMSVYLAHQCGLLKALEIAKTPERSFVSEPRLGIADLHLLPFSLFPSIGDARPDENPAETYQSKIDTGALVVKRLRQNTLLIQEPEGMGQQLIEVARADFDGDGIEDILLFEYCYATHGTLGFGGVTILTRKSADANFERTLPPQA